MENQITQIAQKSLEQLHKNGYIEECIKTEVKKTVGSIINDLFRSYGDFAKSIKEELKKSIKLDFSELNLVEYNHAIINAIQNTIDEEMNIKAKETVTELIKKNLSGDEPKEIKMSELIEKFIEYSYHCNPENGESGEITFIVDDDRTVLDFIYFDEIPNKTKYNCEYRITIDKKGKLNTINCGNKSIENGIFLGDRYGFEQKLFRMYTQGTIIIPDYDCVETVYGPEYE